MTLRDQTTQARSDSSLDEPEKRNGGRLTIVSTPDRKLEGTSSPSLQTSTSWSVARSIAPGVELADTRLSRLHFRIRWDGRSGAFLLGDAGSKNGTSVNGASAASAALAPRRCDPRRGQPLRLTTKATRWRRSDSERSARRGRTHGPPARGERDRQGGAGAAAPRDERSQRPVRGAQLCFHFT